MANVFEILKAAASGRPDAEALVQGDVRLSYGAVARGALCFARFLEELGLERGARVAIIAEKSPASIMAFFGTAAAGLTFVPINPLLKPDQIAFVLGDCDASVLVIGAERARQLRRSGGRSDGLPLAEGAPLVVPDAAQREACEGWAARGLHSWTEITAGGAGDDARAATVIDTDLAALLYTSGSTGKPKGVAVSHRNLLEGAKSVVSYLRNGPTDRILCALPLSFDAGLSQITTAFLAQGTAVLVTVLTGHDVASACAREAITGITGIPPLWHQVLQATWTDEARGRLRYFANTGGAMPASTLAGLRSLFPRAAPFLMYGLTEAFRSTYLDPGQIDIRPSSVGRAIPNARIHVVRPDGSPCDPDEVGELVHVGATVSLGYWKRPDLNALRFRPSPGSGLEGVPPALGVWSGDLFKRDREGYLYFVGREDGMIKTSGYRVSPTEIEDVVMALPGVAEVVAVGIADLARGQVVGVVLVAAGGASPHPEDVISHCRRRLPNYMVPRVVGLEKALPRNPNGKYDRAAIAGRLASGSVGP